MRGALLRAKKKVGCAGGQQGGTSGSATAAGRPRRARDLTRSRRDRRGLGGGADGHLHRLRLRRLQRAEAGNAAGLARLALPRARDLHRRREPRLRARSLTSDWVSAAERSGWNLIPTLRRPAGTVRLEASLTNINAAVAPPPRGSAAADDAVAAPPRSACRGQPDLLRHGGLRDRQPVLLADRADVRLGLGDRAPRTGLRRGCLRQRASTIRDLAAAFGTGLRPPTTSGSPTGTGRRASSAIPTRRHLLGRATSACISTGEATRRPTAGSRSTSTATSSMEPSSRPPAPRRRRRFRTAAGADSAGAGRLRRLG